MSSHKEKYLNSHESYIFYNMMQFCLHEDKVEDEHLSLILSYINFISHVTLAAVPLRLFVTQKVQNYLQKHLNPELMEKQYILFSRAEDEIKYDNNDFFVFLFHEHTQAIKNVIKQKLLQPLYNGMCSIIYSAQYKMLGLRMVQSPPSKDYNIEVIHCYNHEKATKVLITIECDPVKIYPTFYNQEPANVNHTPSIDVDKICTAFHTTDIPFFNEPICRPSVGTCPVSQVLDNIDTDKYTK